MVISVSSSNSPCLRNSRRFRAWPLIGILCAPLAPLRADYRNDIGHAKLALELGGALPTGTGIGVTHVEASGTQTPPRPYMPDTTFAEFSGKTFTPLSGSNAISGHATLVAQIFYGNASSVAPGITSIHNYDANDWLGGTSPTGFLNFGTAAPPNAEPQKVQNHSWIYVDPGVNPVVAAEVVELLRRFDYAIDQSGFLGVVALNNGGFNNVPALLASSYNGVSVGRTDGLHSYGTNTADGSGRMKPEIVAPAGATSYATPIVASAAAMLLQGAPPDAARPVTMKAILMAGATKSQFTAWSRTTTRPLDTVFGAGQLNVYYSHHILAAGQQAASTSATVGRQGWDYRTTTAGSQLYFFDVPTGGTSSLSAILTWNRTISDAFPSPSSSLANLTLKLYAASGFTVGAQIDSSESTVDNVEHVYARALTAGRYAIEVTADQSDVAFGLAWISAPTVSIAATVPAAAEIGPVPGAFTITRSGDTTAALTLSYSIGGTAANGSDCVAIPSSVTIPAGASSATVAVTPIADNLAEGDETVVLTLAPDAAYLFGTASSATVTIKDKPMDAWRFSKFTTAELSDPLLSGDLADFEKDGIVNLHEYAFGLEPKTSDTGGLPIVSIESGGALAIAYTHVKGATDITYIVEVSNDLAMWNFGAGYTSVIGAVDHGATETVKVGSLLAPDPMGWQFMRVRITRP
ncbi:MAG: S8 family serine peptidase [Chthoniobacteraceae bacterium]